VTKRKRSPMDWIPETVLILIILGLSFIGAFYAFTHQP
jgi:hypothetical protein